MITYVVAGDFSGYLIEPGSGGLVLRQGFKKVKLNKETVQSYEIMTEDHQKSATSGIARGLIGGAVFGGIGAVAGILSAKEKGSYQVAVQFKDEKKSLLQMNELQYKLLMQTMF
jgi:hypothetical protein